jgi:hypothetical protein
MRYQQPIDSNDKEHAGPYQHPSRLTDPVTDRDDEPEPDIHVPNTIDIPQILPPMDDAECKAETHVIPLIILSLPSSEHLVGDPPQPFFPDEDFLSPDGTFRSSGAPVWATADMHDINDATRLLLASRLRVRRKRPFSLPSLEILATPSMARWPRWF